MAGKKLKQSHSPSKKLFRVLLLFPVSAVFTISFSTWSWFLVSRAYFFNFYKYKYSLPFHCGDGHRRWACHGEFCVINTFEFNCSTMTNNYIYIFFLFFLSRVSSLQITNANVCACVPSLFHSSCFPRPSAAPPPFKSLLLMLMLLMMMNR